MNKKYINYRKIVSEKMNLILDKRMKYYIDKEYYTPDLYVKRNEIESSIDDFLQSSKSIYMLASESGMGKSFTIFRTIEKLRKEESYALWFNMANQLKSERLEDNINTELNLDKEFSKLIKKLDDENELPERIILIIDGINEFRKSANLIKSCEDFINSLDGLTNIKIIITIDINYIDYLLNSGLILHKELYYQEAISDEPYLMIDELNNKEKEKINNKLKKHKSHKFAVKTPYSKINFNSALNFFLDVPIFIRWLCEAYSGKNLPAKLLPEDVLKRYSEKFLLNEIEKSQFIYRLCINMISIRKSYISVNKAFDDRLLSINIGNISPSSPYVQLKNQSIVNEEFSTESEPYIYFRTIELTRWLISNSIIKTNANIQEVIKTLINYENEKSNILKAVIRTVIYELYKMKEYKHIGIYIQNIKNTISINEITRLFRDLSEVDNNNLKKLISSISNYPSENLIKILLKFTKLLNKYKKFNEMKTYLYYLKEAIGNKGNMRHKALYKFRKAQYYYGKRLFNKAIKQYKKFIDKNFVLEGEEDPLTASSYNNIGNIYFNKGNNDKALKYYNKALPIYIKLYGELYPNTATVYNNIGMAYERKNEYDRALKNYLTAMNIRNELFERLHKDIEESYINIAIVLYKKKDYKKSLEYYNKVLEIRNKAFGVNHPEIISISNSIAVVYEAMSKFDKSIEYYKKSLSISIQNFGEKSRKTAQIYNNLGIVNYNQNKYDEAFEYFKKAYFINSSLSIPEESNTELATSHYHIGMIYETKYDYKKAYEHYNKAYIIRKNIFGKEHIATRLVIYNMNFVKFMIENKRNTLDGNEIPVNPDNKELINLNYIEAITYTAVEYYKRYGEILNNLIIKSINIVREEMTNVSYKSKAYKLIGKRLSDMNLYNNAMDILENIIVKYSYK
ncbi:MAG: tetratricopeptide repeat protein [Spirochaetota bacterium]